MHVAAGPPSYGILPADPILLGLSGKVKLRFVQSLPGARPNTDVSGAVWSSKNASVATVSGGLVTGVSAGTATIPLSRSEFDSATGGVNPDAHTFATIKVLRGAGVETIAAEKQAELLKA